jgi:hypothetical protein
VTAPASLFDIPAVQQAVNYALARLADWQLVPQRVATATSEVRRLARAAADRGDPATVGQLAFLKQSLDGIAQEYQDAAPLVAEVLNAARVAQMGGTVSAGLVPDAAKLTTVMAANLGALAANERAVQDLGGTLTVGPGGGLVLPSWAKWGLIGLGVFWLLKRVL